MTREIFQIHKRLFYLIIVALFLIGSSGKLQAQQIVDRTVATVSDNAVKAQLITYSDLLWQLALQPEAPINPPTSQDLNQALETLINQRLIALEAERLPYIAPSDDEVKTEIKRILALFPSTAEFERRLRLVGFESVNDANFRRMMEQRVAIEKYLDFRFRSFVIVTSEDEMRYYREVYTPEFRKKKPGLLLPPLDDVRPEIHKTLTERKIEDDIEKFLDDAKRRATIEILFEV
jgi:hypothetical protein